LESIKILTKSPNSFLKIAEPESRLGNPFKLLKVNVLQTPEAPKMPTNSPFFTLKEIFRKQVKNC
jgi:hypothetical protein